MSKAYLLNVVDESIKDDKTGNVTEFKVTDILIPQSVNDLGFFVRCNVQRCWDSKDNFIKNFGSQPIKPFQLVEFDIVTQTKIQNNQIVNIAKFKNVRPCSK